MCVCVVCSVLYDVCCIWCVCIWYVVRGIGCVVHGMWCVVCCVLYVVCGVYVCGVYVVCGMLCVVCICSVLYVVRDMWCFVCGV